MEHDLPSEHRSGKVLVTGASGFVGTALCEHLETNEIAFLKGGRGVELSSEMEVEVVVHLASRVHVMLETMNDSLLAYREANTEGTLGLARQAVDAGVRRFIFVSTVKVNGEEGVFSESDTPHAADPYAVSKWEAEQGLQDIAADSGMEVVIIRPPLVYGPGVRANFLSMMGWLNRGVPLPLGAIHNKRSLVALGNLVDFLATCVDHPKAANQTFFVSDGEDLSTTELLARMAAALGRPTRLIPVPAWMLRGGAALLGKRDFSRRLCGSLQVDISKAKNLLGWSPPMSVDEGLRITAEHYLAGLSG